MINTTRRNNVCLYLSDEDLLPDEHSAIVVVQSALRRIVYGKNNIRHSPFVYEPAVAESSYFKW